MRTQRVRVTAQTVRTDGTATGVFTGACRRVGACGRESFGDTGNVLHPR